MSSSARIRRGLLAVVGAALIVLTLALPASAAIIFRERYAGSDTFSYNDCGPIIDVSVEFAGVFQIRSGSGDDASAFFAHDNFWFRETHVRRSDGKTLIVSANGNFVETKATRVEGSIFTFTSVLAGQPFTVHDTDGRLIFRDRGVITETILFDTLGDDSPGGEFLGILDQTFYGQFPSLVSFCDLWAV
jgi:hypothetical protein